MNVAFILHLYQPSFQKKEVLDKIAKESYYPLLKFINNRKDVNLTLNIPLSLLEIMDKYGHKEWIEEIKTLYKSDRIEIIGSAAYHPILSMLPKNIAEDEILLNEYGLGYYLGSKQDFEGFPALMIKDVRGFFPPELAINENIVQVVSSLGYDWMLVSEVAVKGLVDKENVFESVYKYKDNSCYLVCRDRKLSNIISFKRDLDTDDIFNHIYKEVKDATVVALDGEYFGHHYKDGMTLLSIIMDRFRSDGISTNFMSKLVSNLPTRDVDIINESTWNTMDISNNVTDSYPLWFNTTNNIQSLMYDIESNILGCINEGGIVYKNEINVQGGGMSWDMDGNTQLYINIHRMLCSDKYWWMSKKSMPCGEYLYEPGFVLMGLEYFSKVISRISDEEKKKELLSRFEKLKNMIEENHANS
ncbi:hypothetical protein JXA34_02265 [Patescibacteria group bacterium]|nr:hypothetical protein [Patescibacteria group bacterium]